MTRKLKLHPRVQINKHARATPIDARVGAAQLRHHLLRADAILAGAREIGTTIVSDDERIGRLCQLIELGSKTIADAIKLCLVVVDFIEGENER